MNGDGGGGESKADPKELFLYSPLKVVIFVAMMCGMLVLMYFFYNVMGKLELLNFYLTPSGTNNCQHEPSHAITMFACASAGISNAFSYYLFLFFQYYSNKISTETFKRDGSPSPRKCEGF